MVLCLVGNTQLVGQTCHSDGPSLQLRCLSLADLHWPCMFSFTHQFQHSWPERARRGLTTPAQGPHRHPRNHSSLFLGAALELSAFVLFYSKGSSFGLFFLPHLIFINL